jgi:hypothetical protein
MVALLGCTAWFFRHASAAETGGWMSVAVTFHGSTPFGRFVVDAQV